MTSLEQAELIAKIFGDTSKHMIVQTAMLITDERIRAANVLHERIWDKAAVVAADTLEYKAFVTAAAIVRAFKEGLI
jgi:hypothetical protein